jgi:hypothetical protein
MQIADDIRLEIDGINTAQLNTKDNTKSLRDFVLSGISFLEEYNKFDHLLSVWAEGLMSLVEATGTKFGFGNSEVPYGVETPAGEGLTKTEQSDMTLIKGAVLIVAILGTVFTTYLLKAPWTIALAVIAGVICLVFMRQIGDYIRELMQKPEDKIKENNGLSGEIAESVSYMRKRYVQKRFQIKFQYADPHRRNKHDPNDDKALYDRVTQTLETLPSEFMSRIDAITVKCNGVAFERKKVLYSYWKQNSPQPLQQQPMQMGHNA